MANLFGKRISRKELEKRVSRMEQVAGIRLSRLEAGREGGSRVADVHTGSGLNFTIDLSTGMDIPAADFGGRSLCWQSPAGPVAPQFFEPEEIGWLRSFFGGMLTTCGLTYLGDPNVDEGQSLGLHGRVSNLPASRVNVYQDWVGDDYEMRVEGEVIEAVPVVGEHVRLKRLISARLGESRFFIHDEVENFGYASVPHMILYHINTGWPLLEEGSRIIAPATKTIPRTEIAKQGPDKWNEIIAPQVGYLDKDYYHNLGADAEGRVTVAMINPSLDSGLAFYVSFHKEQLPRLVQWKLLAAGTYVTALEPSNCWVEGRATSRKQKDLQFLEPGETRQYDLELGIVCGETAISELENIIQQKS